MKVRIIEKIYHHTNSPILSTPYRTDRELFWIKGLGTAIMFDEFHQHTKVHRV
jgi:hypothetical protein